jgi:hypothetical protein
VWAYLGPAPAPLVPTWEPFTWRNGFVQIVFSEIPCNWFQCGTPIPVLPAGFVFQAGQPEEVRVAYRRAMGLDGPASP